MALSDEVQRKLEACLSHPAAATEITVAMNANTLKTSYSSAAAVTLNTAKTSMPVVVSMLTTAVTATTAALARRFGQLVTGLYTAGHIQPGS